jgi:hypothetical protein
MRHDRVKRGLRVRRNTTRAYPSAPPGVVITGNTHRLGGATSSFVRTKATALDLVKEKKNPEESTMAAIH